MAKYFSLPHLGAGSPEVESLGCYFFRLANAHACTPSQLIGHLGRWWDASDLSATAGPFPRGTLIVGRTPLHGYSEAIERLASALIAATNVQTLRSGTMLSLRHVAAKTALRAFRVNRAWCPACYAEDVANANEPYDRVLWGILAITRCHIHKIELLTTCPRCSTPQDYTGGCRRLSQCSRCGSSLIGTGSCRRPAPKPAFGEKLICDLVSACAENPELTLRWQSISEFFKRARQELSPNDAMRYAPSFTRYGTYPTLDSLLRLATIFNISLLDFQTSKPPPLNFPLYGPERLSNGEKRHPRRPHATHAQVEARLIALLNCGDPLPPYNAFCEQLGVSKGYVNYRFPDLAQRYLQQRRLTRVSEHEASIRAAVMAIDDNGLWEAYQDGRIKQLKQLTREVARLARVSIPIARKVVEARSIRS